MIRKAEKKDVEFVIPLILVILKDMELAFLIKHGDAVTLEVLRQGFITEDYRYSYRRAIVEEEEGEVVGVVFGYPNTDEPIIDHALSHILKNMGHDGSEKLFTDPETFDNEWYLDTLSVRSDQRGKGLGSKLIEALPDFIDSKVIGLNVDQGNPRAKKLYTKLGFKTVGNIAISGHDYEHMQKSLL